MREDVYHLYLAILIFYSFLMDLNGKEEMTCINGRRKRIKSFVPYAQEMVSMCASSIGAMSVWHDAPERVEDALRLSMATGANVVECPGLGDFAKVDEYKKNIEVRQVC